MIADLIFKETTQTKYMRKEMFLDRNCLQFIVCNLYSDIFIFYYCLQFMEIKILQKPVN